MKEILEMLDRNHLPYAIVTSGSKKRVTLLLNRLQWYARFEFIIAREDARASKPKPDPYIEAFSRIRLPKSKILVVEDSDNGVTSAKKAGFTVWQLIGPTSNQLLTNNAGDSEALMNWILSR
jgi:HAD superfamily hydrolase (TIGR01509 family)